MSEFECKMEEFQLRELSRLLHVLTDDRAIIRQVEALVNYTANDHKLTARQRLVINLLYDSLFAEEDDCYLDDMSWHDGHPLNFGDS